MAWYSSVEDLGSGIVEVGTFGALKGAFKDNPTFLGRSLSEYDPTKVKKVETAPLETAVKDYQTAAGQAQQMIGQRMGQIQTPTIAKTAGPQAGQIDPSFLQALQARMPSQAQALQGFQAQGQTAAQRASEATEMLRAAALGQTQSAAQMQQRQAFEEAIAAQMAAQAGRGYDPAAFRQAQRAGAQLMGQQAQQAGILAAQEQEAARKSYATIAQQGAQTAIQQQDLQLRAAQGDVDAQIKLAGLQTDIAKAQAGLTTQAGIAGAQIGSEQAISQAQLQQQTQQQINSLTELYVKMGLEPANAQLEAQKAVFGAQWQRSQMQTEARQKMFGGLLSGAGAAAGLGV